MSEGEVGILFNLNIPVTVIWAYCVSNEAGGFHWKLSRPDVGTTGIRTQHIDTQKMCLIPRLFKMAEEMVIVTLFSTG